ncbi:superfamily I DNA/RNA helicase [Streptomyces aurantiacus]|uniref:UvrD-helicase domain-containing protein n=1 Tax=Streptomyces aurantiacus TaxID=47760 RepID=UPI00278CC80D|nr:superfamily I DNA/RNA helicase [Streptomyces aurantiacus]
MEAFITSTQPQHKPKTQYMQPDGGTMKFTDAQRAAIQTYDDNLLIVACAGSGKTEVISQRIAGLIGQPDVLPRNIVAFTFTEKAAGELKERVHTRIRELHGEVHGLAEMYIGTMHGYALDLLHSHVPEAFKFNVLNDVQTRLIIDKYSTKSGLTTTSTATVLAVTAGQLVRWCGYGWGPCRSQVVGRRAGRTA